LVECKFFDAAPLIAFAEFQAVTEVTATDIDQSGKTDRTLQVSNSFRSPRPPSAFTQLLFAPGSANDESALTYLPGERTDAQA
jgi:hypothetical protein